MVQMSSCENCDAQIWEDPKSGIWRHLGGDRTCPGSPVATPAPSGKPVIEQARSRD